MHIYLQSGLQQTTENQKYFIHNCSSNINIPLFSVLQSQAVIPEGSTCDIVVNAYSTTPNSPLCDRILEGQA